MAYSIVQYTGDGSTSIFSVTFPYISKSHVSVTVNGVAATFTWPTSATIQITPTPAGGTVVQISRSTSPSVGLVDYVNGSPLGELDLDAANLQLLYLAQEGLDLPSRALSLNGSSLYDAGNHRIINVANPVSALDAVNKQTLDAAAFGGTLPLASSITNTPAGNISGTTVQAALNELDTEKLALAGGTMVGNLTLAADPSSALHAATKQYVDAAGSSGFMRPTFEAAAPSGWLLLQGGSVGSATSSATVRANADTAGLYAYLWNNLPDTVATVTGGRGASAAADFAANKRILLPDFRNRMLIGAGQSTVAESFANTAVNTATDTITVASNDRRWITGTPVVFTIQSGSLTPLANATTYYVVRTSSTTIKLSTSLANAQNGTVIDLTAVAAGSFTITYTFPTRTVGETGGEDTHPLSVSEMPSHGHTQNSHSHTYSDNEAGTGGTAGYFDVAIGTGFTAASVSTAGATATNNANGGTVAMNLLAPFFVLNWIIKL